MPRRQETLSVHESCQRGESTLGAVSSRRRAFVVTKIHDGRRSHNHRRRSVSREWWKKGMTTTSSDQLT